MTDSMARRSQWPCRRRAPNHRSSHITTNQGNSSTPSAPSTQRSACSAVPVVAARNSTASISSDTTTVMVTIMRARPMPRPKTIVAWLSACSICAGMGFQRPMIQSRMIGPSRSFSGFSPPGNTESMPTSATQ